MQFVLFRGGLGVWTYLTGFTLVQTPKCGIRRVGLEFAESSANT